MSKGKRNRDLRGVPQDSIDAMRALDPHGHLDQKLPVAKSRRRADGMPPPEVIKQFLEDARGQGCACEPNVVVHKSAEGGGAIALLHKDFCPLIRVLDEEAR